MNSAGFAPPQRSRRVLLVDDNCDAAELLAEYLRECGHRVAIATEPKIALELGRTFTPEVVLLDIGLPFMDGYELAARLRSQSRGAIYRFIAVTGYGRDRDRELSSAAGFEHHLVKPVDVEGLEKIIRADG
jgi:CheY-like chemotaxis protein